MKLPEKENSLLLLEDGLFLKGSSIGKKGTTGGEICFNTGMTGYQEIYTDPSYYGQIIINTTPHIGNYGVLDEEAGIPFRGLFLIDKKGVVRHQLINDLPLGRSVDEVLRMIDALTFFEKHGEVCPANWKEGEKSMKPTKEGLEAYFAKA